MSIGSGRRWARRPAVLAGTCLAAALAFSALAVLVSLGKLDTIDSYALRHWMPWFGPNQKGTSWLGSVLSYHGRQFHATKAVELPAGVIAASVLAVVVCAVLWWRGRRGPALLWLAGFGVANAVALLCKSTITRPELQVTAFGGPFHIDGFDSSFPSGHALRAALLAAIAAFAWPFLRWLVLAWLVAVVLALDLNGVHTPSDILGGLLLGGAAVLAVLLLIEELPSAARSPAEAVPRNPWLPGEPPPSRLGYRGSEPPP